MQPAGSETTVRLSWLIPCEMIQPGGANCGPGLLFSGDLEIRAMPEAGAAVVEKIGRVMVRILPDENPSGDWLKLVTLSGRLALPRDVTPLLTGLLGCDGHHEEPAHTIRSRGVHRIRARHLPERRERLLRRPGYGPWPLTSWSPGRPCRRDLCRRVDYSGRPLGQRPYSRPTVQSPAPQDLNSYIGRGPGQCHGSSPRPGTSRCSSEQASGCWQTLGRASV